MMRVSDMNIPPVIPVELSNPLEVSVASGLQSQAVIASSFLRRLHIPTFLVPLAFGGRRTRSPLITTPVCTSLLPAASAATFWSSS